MDSRLRAIGAEALDRQSFDVHCERKRKSMRARNAKSLLRTTHRSEEKMNFIEVREVEDSGWMSW